MQLKLTKFCDSLHPVDEATATWAIRLGEGEIATLELTEQKATPAQRRAKWLYCTRLAAALNDAGYDMKAFPWREGYLLDWTKESVAARLWTPVADAMFGKEGTKQLTTHEVKRVYENVDRHVAKNTGVTVAFPSRELRDAA